MKLDVKDVAKILYKRFSKHSQTVTGFGAVLGLGITTVLAYRTAGKVKKINDERKEALQELDEEDEDERKEVNSEANKKVVKAVAPVVIAFVTTGACMIGSVLISNKKISDLTAIANYSQLAYQELLEQNKKELGEDKALEIQKKAEEKTNERIEETKEVSISEATKQGSRKLFVDYLSRQKFWIEEKDLYSIVSYFNDAIKRDGNMYCTDILLREFYNKIAAKGNRNMYDIPLSEGFAWRSNTYKTTAIQLNINNAVLTPEGEAAVLLDFYERPKYYEDLT